MYSVARDTPTHQALCERPDWSTQKGMAETTRQGKRRFLWHVAAHRRYACRNDRPH